MPNQPTNRPGMPMTLVASAARTTSSNSGNLKDTTTPWPTSDNYSICLNVTAYSYAPGTTGAQGFDVYIDQLLGDGSTWVRAQKFATITTSTATSFMNFRRGVLVSAAEETGTGVINTTSAKLGNVIMSRDVRVRWEATTNGVATVSTTFSVTAFANPD